jgi:hypothetical protein
MASAVGTKRVQKGELTPMVNDHTTLTSPQDHPYVQISVEAVIDCGRWKIQSRVVRGSMEPIETGSLVSPKTNSHSQLLVAHAHVRLLPSLPSHQSRLTLRLSLQSLFLIRHLQDSSSEDWICVQYQPRSRIHTQTTNLVNFGLRRFNVQLRHHRRSSHDRATMYKAGSPLW